MCISFCAATRSDLYDPMQGTELAGAQEARLLRNRNTGYAYGEKGQPHPQLAKGQAANEYPENGNGLNGAPGQGSLNVDAQPAV